MEAATFAYNFKGRDAATFVFRRVGSEFGKLHRQSKVASMGINTALGGMVGGVVGASLGIGTLKKAFNFASTAGEFDQAMVAVAKTAGATAAEMAKLEQKAMDVALSTKFAPKEIADGMKDMASLGKAPVEIINGIGAAADLATAGQIKLDRASRALIGTMASFGIKSERTTEVADKLTFIIQNTAFQAADFEKGLSKSAAAMGLYGQSLEETLVLTGALRNMNLQASVSSTALRNAVQRLAAKKSALNAVEAKGVEVYDKATGKMRPMTRILLDLRVAMDKMSESEKNLFLAQHLQVRGLFAYAAALKLGRFEQKKMADGTMKRVWVEGADAFRSLLDDMDKSKGAARSFASALIDTYKGQLQLLEGASAGFSVAMGQAFADVLKPVVGSVVGALTVIVKGINKLSPEMKKVVAAGVLGTASLLAFGGAATVATFAITAMVAMMAPAWPLFAVAAGTLGLLGAAAVTTGLGLAGMAVSGKKGAQGFGAALQSMWNDAKIVFDGIGQALSGDGKIRGKTLEELIKPENEGLLKWVVTVVRWVDRAKKFSEGMWSGFKQGVDDAQPAIDALKASFKGLTDSLGITNKEGKAFNGSQSEAAKRGHKLGQTIAHIAEVGIKFMTVMTDLATLVVDNWDGITFTLKAVLGVLLAIAGVKAGKGLLALGGTLGGLGKKALGIGRLTPGGKAAKSGFGGFAGKTAGKGFPGAAGAAAGGAGKAAAAAAGKKPPVDLIMGAGKNRAQIEAKKAAAEAAKARHAAKEAAKQSKMGKVKAGAGAAAGKGLGVLGVGLSVMSADISDEFEKGDIGSGLLSAGLAAGGAAMGGAQVGGPVGAAVAGISTAVGSLLSGVIGVIGGATDEIRKGEIAMKAGAAYTERTEFRGLHDFNSTGYVPISVYANRAKSRGWKMPEEKQNQEGQAGANKEDQLNEITRVTTDAQVAAQKQINSSGGITVNASPQFARAVANAVSAKTMGSEEFNKTSRLTSDD